MAVNFPTEFIVSACEWNLISNTQVHKSPLSGAVQTLELPGAKWSATLTLTNQMPVAARRLAAFLTSLRGQAVGFYLFDHSHPIPAGSAPGIPVVSGPDQIGSQLVTSGWDASETGILIAGDYIQVDNELKMVVADADSDATGTSTLQIEPPWRNSPTDASSVVTNYPKALMKLTTNMSGLKVSPPLLSETTITCIEDISI